MTLIKIDKSDKVIMTKKEKQLFINLVERHLELMPNVYRKRNRNWVVVQHLTWHGRTYSEKICEFLGIDPSSYKWEIKNEALL